MILLAAKADQGPVPLFNRAARKILCAFVFRAIFLNYHPNIRAIRGSYLEGKAEG